MTNLKSSNTEDFLLNATHLCFNQRLYTLLKDFLPTSSILYNRPILNTNTLYIWFSLDSEELLKTLQLINQLHFVKNIYLVNCSYPIFHNQTTYQIYDHTQECEAKDLKYLLSHYEKLSDQDRTLIKEILPDFNNTNKIYFIQNTTQDLPHYNFTKLLHTIHFITISKEELIKKEFIDTYNRLLDQNIHIHPDS